MKSKATSKRKLSHIQTTLHEDVQSHRHTGFDDVHFVHRALPEINRDEVETSVELFGYKLSAPIMVESMTGGTPLAAKINGGLGKVAEELHIAMGVGSQRAGLEDPSVRYTYRAARDSAPSVPIFANLGCPQLTKADALERVKAAIDMIDANGLFIHLNALQESVQFEGETNFAGMLQRIRDIASKISVPVLVKETGAGISSETAIACERAGVKGINVSGLGGTSWAAVEYYRAREKGHRLQMQIGSTYWDWGVPTAASIVEVAKSTKLKVFASGGVRNGLHIAKSIALGAHYGGLALPLLKSISKSTDEAKQKLRAVVEEIRTAMFLTGCRTIEDLRRAPVVITGETLDWLEQRGLDVSMYGRRP